MYQGSLLRFSSREGSNRLDLIQRLDFRATKVTSKSRAARGVYHDLMMLMIIRHRSRMLSNP